MKLEAIAEAIGAELVGDGSVDVTGAATLQDAGPSDITFMVAARHAPKLAASGAAAAIVPADWGGEAPCAVLRVRNPDYAFGQAASLLVPPAPTFEPGVHPTAVVSPDATIGNGVYLGPHVVVEAGATIGDGCTLVAQVYVGHNSRLGASCLVHAGASIRERVTIGDRAIIHNGAVVGSDGFGYAQEQGQWLKIPQVGIVRIGDDVEIGANTTIDRARFGETVLGDRVKIDNLCQIAHNVRIGDDSACAAQVGIAGSTELGRGVQLGGQVGVTGHIKLGDYSVATGGAAVIGPVPEKTVVIGWPADEIRKYKRMHAHTQRLPKLKEQVRELQQRLDALEAAAKQDDGAN